MATMEEQKKTREIDVVAEARKVLGEWKLLLKAVGIGAVAGVVVALASPKEYTANVVLAPEMSSGGFGMSESLGSLASSFGIDLGGRSSADALYPELYPEIFASTDFVLGLFDVPVRLKEGGGVRSYKEHLKKDTKTPFWRYPMILARKLLAGKAETGDSGADPFKISKDDDKLCEAIRGAISCLVDNKTSVITIAVQDQDPLVAAIMADTLQSRLQEYITSYRTKKARNDYDYYKKLYEESKAEYIRAQQAYASYADANQDVILQTVKAKTDNLENEMQLRYNTYTQMAVQLQVAGAKIQERTPAFTMIEKATMPHKASSMPRSFIVALFMLLAVAIDSLWVCFIRDFMKKRK